VDKPDIVSQISMETVDQMALLKKVCDALEGKLRFRSIPEKFSIVAMIGNNIPNHSLLIQVNESLSTIQLILRYERKTSQHRQEEMSVLISQANCSACKVGGLEMDETTGEVQYRHGVDAVGISVTDEFVRALVAAHVKQGERCWKGVEAVMNGTDYRTALSFIT
jgi:hypothetical protein